MKISHGMNGITSCPAFHIHDPIQVNLTWDSEDPLSVTVGILAPTVYPDGVVTFDRVDDLTFVVARELFWNSSRRHSDAANDFKVRGTTGAITMKVRKSDPSAMTIIYPKGIFMVERKKVVKFCQETFNYVEYGSECNEVMLDKLAAQLLYG